MGPCEFLVQIIDEDSFIAVEEFSLGFWRPDAIAQKIGCQEDELSPDRFLFLDEDQKKILNREFGLCLPINEPDYPLDPCMLVVAYNGHDKKSPSACPEFSVREFFQRFPDEDACLEHIMPVRFGGTRFDCPSCGAVGATFHKLRERRVLCCAACLSPDRTRPRTPSLHDTRTPLVSLVLRDVSVLHDAPRCERQGTPTPAWRDLQDRLAHRAANPRPYEQGAGLRRAAVRPHRTGRGYVGGRRSGGKRGRGAPGKTIVMGLAERGGRMKAVVIPER